MSLKVMIEFRDAVTARYGTEEVTAAGLAAVQPFDEGQSLTIQQDVARHVLRLEFNKPHDHTHPQILDGIAATLAERLPAVRIYKSIAPARTKRFRDAHSEDAPRSYMNVRLG